MRNQPSPGAYAWIAVVSLFVVAVMPQPAVAKGLFESIFGFLGSKPQSAPAPRAVSRSGSSGIRFHNRQRSNSFDANSLRRRSVQPSYRGRYKTVCVRLCDGYFFPISHSSRRRDFYNDAQQCKSRCDSDTRLFHMSPSAGSVKFARDQRGLTYSKLKTAFLYRKTLKPGCACRPKPWSVAERMRHRSYSLVVPGSESGDVVIADETAPVVAAKPKMVGEGAAEVPTLIEAPVPVALLQAPAPRAVARTRRTRRYTERRRPVPKKLVARPRRLKKKSWGLGASYGGK